MLVLLLPILLAGCATIKVVYPRLDWYAAWRLKDYVALDDRQQALFKEKSAEFWAWNRTQALPGYAEDLRAIASADPSVIEPATLEKWSGRVEVHGTAVVEHVLPGLCALAPTLDEAQIASIGKRLHHDLGKFADEHLDGDEGDIRRHEEKQLAKSIKRWAGPLNDAQEKEIRAWRDEHRLLGRQTLELRRAWNEAFVAALRRHDDPGQCAALRELLLEPRDLRPPETKALFDANETLLRATVARVIADSDETQREHAKKALEKLADDLDALATGT